MPKRLSSDERTIDMSEQIEELELDNQPFLVLLKKAWPRWSDEHRWMLVRILLQDRTLTEAELREFAGLDDERG